MRLIDWVVLLIFVFGLASVPSAYYSANSVPRSEATSFAVLGYFVIRLTTLTPLTTAWLAGFLGFSGASLAVSGIFEFVAGTKSLGDAALTDFVAFRSRLIHPIRGWVPGECFTVFLLALPFSCAAAAYVWRGSSVRRKKAQLVLALLPAGLIAGALSLSLSRSVFWSTVLFLFVSCLLIVTYEVVTPKTGFLLLGGGLGCLLIVLICETALYPGILRVYGGGHTSQVRSTHGHLNIWNRSLELTRGHRFWGVGSGNTALFLTSSADPGETTDFASRAFSLPIQILVENGLIGFALYAAFLFLVAREFHRGMRSPPLAEARSNSATGGRKTRNPRRNINEEDLRLQNENAGKAMRCCFAAGIVAVLFRELTYSSLFEHTLTLAMAFTLASLVCVDERA